MVKRFTCSYGNEGIVSCSIPLCQFGIGNDRVHMETKYLEVFLMMNSEDAASQERLEELKKQFTDLAQNATIAD